MHVKASRSRLTNGDGLLGRRGQYQVGDMGAATRPERAAV